MSYAEIERRLQNGGLIILDGGTGTELERRGVEMNPGAWCGPATLENTGVLEEIHRDYIAAGADVITANTYASSRLMLRQAGLSDQFEEINKTAVATAHKARSASSQDDILVAGSLSHMCGMVGGTANPDLGQQPSEAEMTEAFTELAQLLLDEGCDLIILEMMFYPERIPSAFKAAASTGLPVWAGFSARRAKSGQVLSFAPESDFPLSDIAQILGDFDIAAAGTMHTPSNLIGDANAVIRSLYSGPLMAYPDSGYFKMPHWQFEDVIPPAEFAQFADEWVENGAKIVGGCCGLSPDHIAALRPLKERAAV